MLLKSDFELVKDFQAGKIEAYNELVRRYQQKVYWISRRLVGDHNDADDITQDVFVKVYKALADFRSQSSFFTWLYRITVNMSISSIRRKKIIEFINFDNTFSTLNSIVDDSINPESQLEIDENLKLLEEAITKLPRMQKKVFILRYFEELPYEEISKILNRKVSGLKANYFYALKNIQKFVKDKIKI